MHSNDLKKKSNEVKLNLFHVKNNLKRSFIFHLKKVKLQCNLRSLYIFNIFFEKDIPTCLTGLF